jgi:hypothetical protein
VSIHRENVVPARTGSTLGPASPNIRDVLTYIATLKYRATGNPA